MFIFHVVDPLDLLSGRCSNQLYRLLSVVMTHVVSGPVALSALHVHSHVIILPGGLISELFVIRFSLSLSPSHTVAHAQTHTHTVSIRDSLAETDTHTQSHVLT